jgi:hypothetical protein
MQDIVHLFIGKINPPLCKFTIVALKALHSLFTNDVGILSSFPFFLVVSVLDFFSFISLRLKLLSMSQLVASVRSPTVFAYRRSLCTCCFDQKPASSSVCYLPETHFIIPKYRCFEDLRQGRPPIVSPCGMSLLLRNELRSQKS